MRAVLSPTFGRAPSVGRAGDAAPAPWPPGGPLRATHPSFLRAAQYLRAGLPARALRVSHMPLPRSRPVEDSVAPRSAWDQPHSPRAGRGIDVIRSAPPARSGLSGRTRKGPRANINPAAIAICARSA